MVCLGPGNCLPRGNILLYNFPKILKVELCFSRPTCTYPHPPLEEASEGLWELNHSFQIQERLAQRGLPMCPRGCVLRTPSLGDQRTSALPGAMPGKATRHRGNKEGRAHQSLLTVKWPVEGGTERISAWRPRGIWHVCGKGFIDQEVCG